MLLWGFISTSSASTPDTLFGAHASPELAEPAGIALALADGDAVLALVAPPFEGPATRDAEVGLSTQGQEEQKHGYCCDLAPHG